jgi:hedgehog
MYSEVLMFLDRETNHTHQFVQIQTDGNHNITVTPAHLLMVWLPNERTTKFMFADRVQEDDYLLVNVVGGTRSCSSSSNSINSCSNSNNLEPRKVKRVSVRLSRGIYAPLTRAGTVVVDSIAASCYALVDSQTIAHWSFMPIRAINTITNWLQDTSPSLPKSTGINWYAKALYSFKDLILPTDWIYH